MSSPSMRIYSCFSPHGQFFLVFHFLGSGPGVGAPSLFMCCVYLYAQSCLCKPHGWQVAPQVPLSMEFSRQESWNGLPFPTPGDLRNPGIETASLASPAFAGRFFTTVPPGCQYDRRKSLPGSQVQASSLLHIII